jgi:RNA binding exosome subunit
MIKSADELYVPDKIEIDLRGQYGNAYHLLALAQRLGKDKGYPKEYIDACLEKMKESDYENLLDTFDKIFGEDADIYR